MLTLKDLCLDETDYNHIKDNLEHFSKVLFPDYIRVFLNKDKNIDEIIQEKPEWSKEKNEKYKNLVKKRFEDEIVLFNSRVEIAKYLLSNQNEYELSSADKRSLIKYLKIYLSCAKNRAEIEEVLKKPLHFSINNQEYTFN